MNRVRLPVPGPTARAWITRVAWVLVGLFVLGFFPLAVVTGNARGIGFWGAAVTVVAIVAVLWAGVVRPGRREGAARRGLASPTMQVAEKVERPVQVPDDVEGPVAACMRCGSRDLAMPGMRDGVWLGGGELQFMVCRNCNSRAPPLEFERGEDYVRFLRELETGRTG